MSEYLNIYIQKVVDVEEFTYLHSWQNNIERKNRFVDIFYIILSIVSFYSLSRTKRYRIEYKEVMGPHGIDPNGIEPTFLKLDSWSPGAGFIPIITYNVLN